MKKSICILLALILALCASAASAEGAGEGTGPESRDYEHATVGNHTKLDGCFFTGMWGTITNFSGIRAHENGGDFVIGAVPGLKGAYEALGIESPGLSAAPAIGEKLGSQVAQEAGLEIKKEIVPPMKRPKPFHDMSNEERAEAVAKDPDYGKIVCRCEVVTEAEIREAIRRPVGARSVDAVKRRTRAGMGRCQGGFCSPRVMEILSEEMGVPMIDITKNGGGSYLLTGRIDDTLGKE